MAQCNFFDLGFAAQTKKKAGFLQTIGTRIGSCLFESYYRHRYLISALVCYCMVGLLSPLLSKVSLMGSPELPLPHTRDITSGALPSVKYYKTLRHLLIK